VRWSAPGFVHEAKSSRTHDLVFSCLETPPSFSTNGLGDNPVDQTRSPYGTGAGPSETQLVSLRRGARSSRDSPCQRTPWLSLDLQPTIPDGGDRAVRHHLDAITLEFPRRVLLEGPVGVRSFAGVGATKVAGFSVSEHLPSARQGNTARTCQTTAGSQERRRTALSSTNRGDGDTIFSRHLSRLPRPRVKSSARPPRGYEPPPRPTHALSIRSCNSAPNSTPVGPPPTIRKLRTSRFCCVVMYG
jgi:hypothetical protein